MNSIIRSPSPARRRFDFGANHPALDLVNTVNGRPIFTRDDLAGPDDVIEWAVAAGLVKHSEQVGGDTGSSSRLALSQFVPAITLRESIYQVFGPIAVGGVPESKALAYLTWRAAQALRSSEWQRVDKGYAPKWSSVSVESIGDRLADEAVQLLRSPLIDRVGSCAGCGWLFLDVSRANARRWCSMNACGVRDKMRRYHQRHLDTVRA